MSGPIISSDALHSAAFPDILGQDPVKEQVRSALLANRHLILVGPPGVGKTTLARAVACLIPARRVRDCPFRCDPDDPRCPRCVSGTDSPIVTLTHERAFVRVQGSPDLTAEDLLGDIDPIKALQYGPLSVEAFTPGKIFQANRGILFFDEINRCSEKLQNALLQALEERRVTIGSYDIDFPADFLLIGTMNPDDTSTEELSQVFLDRFDLIAIGYPETTAVEDAIVTSRRAAVPGVRTPGGLQQAVVSFVRQLRADRNLERKPGVRASIGIVDRAATTASLRGHVTVTPEDVAAVLTSVLAHRLAFKPSVKYLEDPIPYIMKRWQAFAREHDLEGGVP